MSRRDTWNFWELKGEDIPSLFFLPAGRAAMRPTVTLLTWDFDDFPEESPPFLPQGQTFIWEGNTLLYHLSHRYFGSLVYNIYMSSLWLLPLFWWKATLAPNLVRGHVVQVLTNQYVLLPYLWLVQSQLYDFFSLFCIFCMCDIIYTQ